LKTDVIMLESLFEDIKSDFSSLWTCKQRGESVEIVTPYMDLHSEAIVVYLTKRGNRYIVTDGGRVGSVAEKEEIDLSERKNIHYSDLLEYYEVLRSEHDNRTFCYKSSDSVEMLSSLIYDIVHFHKALVDAIYLESLFSDGEAREKYFGTVVKDIVRQKIAEESKNKKRYELIHLDELNGLQFNSLVLEKDTQTIWSSMAIYGKDMRGLRNSVQRAQYGFDYVKKNFSGNMKMAAVIDEIPKSVANRKDAHVFIASINEWPRTFQSDNYLIGEFRRVQSIETLFGHRRAS